MPPSMQSPLEGLPVRPEYAAALAGAIDALANAGVWLHGATRIAIAQVARYALADPEPLAPWELPSAATARVARMTSLPLAAVAVDAVHEDDRAALAVARDALSQALGADAMVDAAGVIGNFTMMTRIADSTGTPLDAGSVAISEPIRTAMGVDAFPSVRMPAC